MMKQERLVYISRSDMENLPYEQKMYFEASQGINELIRTALRRSSLTIFFNPFLPGRGLLLKERICSSWIQFSFLRRVLFWEGVVQVSLSGRTTEKCA